MPKRPVSTGISCLGCSANFDTETHIPFVGSCGDSICTVCLNEKKFKNCPECHLEGAFACKQKNTLAMKLLSAVAENDASDSKKAKLDVGDDTDPSGEPVPAILDPKNLPFLAQIVNQLNPISFLNLASTCKTLKNYCFNCKDVKIIYDIYYIYVKMDRDGFKFDIQESADFDVKVDDDGGYTPSFLPLGYTGYRHGFMSSVYGRKKLRKYPFEFRLDHLEFHEVNRFDDAFFTTLRTFFAEFSIKTVSSFQACTDPESNWVFPAVSEDLMQFLKDFRIMRVDFNCAEFDGDINEEFLNYLLQNTASFSIDRIIPERLLLNASVPNLTTSVSKRVFVDLIKKFADSTDEMSWRLRCDFELHAALRSFKLLPFDYEGPLPDEHPIIFVKNDNPKKCWLLRKDGKVLKCLYLFRYMSNTILLFMCSPRNYPLCIRREAADPDDESEPEPDVDFDDELESGGDSDDEPESEGDSDDESND